MEDQNQKLSRIRKLSILLDTQYKVGGFHFGWDALLGLFPLFGDFITTILSFYIIFEAALLGCPIAVLLRMVVNVMVENGMDFIPVVGNMFDFIWKSNRKNIGLLEAYLKRPDHIRRQSNLAIFFIFFVFVLVLALGLFGGYLVFSTLKTMIFG
jgi:hypothetical protein